MVVMLLLLLKALPLPQPPQLNPGKSRKIGPKRREIQIVLEVK